MATDRRWQGYGFLEVDRRGFRSGPLSPSGDALKTAGIIHNGRRPIAPGAIQLFELERGLTSTPSQAEVVRQTIAVQFRRGGRGHLVVLPAPSSGGSPPAGSLFPSRIGRRPGMLASLGGSVFPVAESGGTLQAPYYESGSWLQGPANIPDKKCLLGDIADFDPSTEHFHASGKVLRSSIPLRNGGAYSSWREMAWRVVWGPDAPIDLSGFAHYMAVLGALIPGELEPNNVRYILLQFSSYPYRRDRADDHADVAGMGGTDDTAWRFQASLALPAPVVTIPGWPGPGGTLNLQTAASLYNPTDPPESVLLDHQVANTHIVFPFARALQQEVTVGDNPALIDFSRITAMSIRVLYSSTVGEGGANGASWSFVGPFLAWNTFEGAFVDPVFASNTFHMPLLVQYAPRLSIANLGDVEDEVSFFLGPTGVPVP